MGTLHLRSELAICANNCLSSEPVLPQADRATRPGLQLYQQFGGRSPQTFLSQRHLTVFGAGMTGRVYGCCVEDGPLVGRVHDSNEPHFGAPKNQRLKIRCARIVPTLSIKGERTTGRHYIVTPSASEGWA